MKGFLLFVFLWAISVSDQSQQLNRVCYYVKDQQMTAENIDPSLCSHIIFGFARVEDNNLVPETSTDPKLYSQFLDMKKTEPNLKILIGITGSDFSFVDSSHNRALFVNNSLLFMRKYGFDGLDIDWEFPGWNGPYSDRQGFLELLKDLHTGKSDMYPSDKGPLISVAVSASLTIIDWSYNIPEMAKYVDFISIMCYDYNFYRKYLPFTGHNSPLFKHTRDVFFYNTWNIEWSANYWASAGMPKSKIMVGLPTYGHTFRLLDPNENGVYALTIGPGSGDGWITYTEVCDVIRKGGIKAFDNESLVPYVYQDSNWISYDDVTSITYKAKWIVENNFSGAMTWNLNSDDWAGNCSDVKFPLHKVLRDKLIH